ncbi:DEAD/DEAH box helicase [Saccharopolyspora rosea]|uniref:DEAD/DEAH box helicase n=1 Tax=Saccharopolyspora rosea TaxID=524884 RepID=UPI0021D86E22|nr:DEAD/DEAH box helicase family protein [Saccharopolyspora rosea]
MEAWCPECNLRLGDEDVGEPAGLIPRVWQALALPKILRRIWYYGSATLQACPGAGKTEFAAMVFKMLYDAGYVSRMVVVVPNRHLVDQWKHKLGLLRIHLDAGARLGALERKNTVGLVVTYHSLPGAAEMHATRLEQERTLVVLDEVHHVAERLAWGRAVECMVGDVTGDEVRATAVLNMTGTLFRSSNKLRISTVRYDRVEIDGDTKLQAIPDWSLPTPALIGFELRAPDLLVYGGEAHLFDFKKGKDIKADVADLDDYQRSAAIRAAFTSPDWMEGFAREAVKELRAQLDVFDGAVPLKLLFLVPTQQAAYVAAEALNKVTRQRDFAYVVVSEEPKAGSILRAAARKRRPCAIVAVRMITEGFDCPEVSTIAYASNVVAPLFISQMMARAMRLTKTERAKKQYIPAKILIPDHKVLREAFAAALSNVVPLIDEKDEYVEIHPDGLPRMPRFELRELDDPQLRSLIVLDQEDGEVGVGELNRVRKECEQNSVPGTFAGRIALIHRRLAQVTDVDLHDDEDDEDLAMTLATAAAGTPDLVRSYRDRISKAVTWMRRHIEHDARYASIGVFQALANARAGVDEGRRTHATAAELASIADYMLQQICTHCREFNEKVPSWAEGWAG